MSSKRPIRNMDKSIFGLSIAIFSLTLATVLGLVFTVGSFIGPTFSSGAATSSKNTSAEITSSDTSSDTSSNFSSNASSNTSSNTSSSTPMSSVPSLDVNHPYYDAIIEALKYENNRTSYWFGTNRDSQNRPLRPLELQESLGKYGMTAITNDEGRIYLTFDEGYEYNNNTTKILDILAEKNCKATFFITMHFAKANPQLVRRMIDEGHVVGNHSVNHPTMPNITLEQASLEIMQLHDYVKENFGYEMKLFRPPTGAYSTATLVLAKELGYRTVEWSWAYGDYDENNQPNPEASLNNILSASHGGAIYLLHAMSNTNVEILGDVIDGWKEQGYTISAFPNISPTEPTLGSVPMNPSSEETSSGVESQDLTE